MELFQIGQSGFPFSSFPSDVNKALRDPFKSICSCLQRGPVPAIRGAKHRKDRLQDGGCALPWLTGTGTATRCKAPGDCLQDCSHHHDPA